MLTRSVETRYRLETCTPEETSDLVNQQITAHLASKCRCKITAHLVSLPASPPSVNQPRCTQTLRSAKTSHSGAHSSSSVSRPPSSSTTTHSMPSLTTLYNPNLNSNSVRIHLLMLSAIRSEQAVQGSGKGLATSGTITMPI